MNRIVVTVGSSLIVLGVLVSILSFPIAPRSETLVNETFAVPAGMYYSYYITFSLPRTLHIDFTVESGAVNFWVMNETDYQKMASALDFNYYTAPSGGSITKADIDWAPPLNTKIYFVWDNIFSSIPRAVTAVFVYGDYRPILPSGILSIGFIVLFLGVGTTIYGYRPPTGAKKNVVAGYVFAALGGLLGIAIGLDLSRKEAVEEKFHGKVILIVGTIAILTYILVLLLPK